MLSQEKLYFIINKINIQIIPLLRVAACWKNFNIYFFLRKRDVETGKEVS